MSHEKPLLFQKHRLAREGDPKCPATSTQGIPCNYFEGHGGPHYNQVAELTFETEEIVPAPLTLKVSEIFYSLQGEGARAGEASIFIRLQGCSAKFACAAAGVTCDTEFESGKEMTLPELIAEVNLAVIRALFGSKELDAEQGDALIHTYQSSHTWIVFTGGEPLDQLNAEILSWFKSKGYKIAIETSGIKPVDEFMATCIDHLTVSPKVAEHILEKHFGGLHLRGNRVGYFNVDELRYVRHAGQPGLPQPKIEARYYYLSPHSDGGEINPENLKHCIRLCLENPQWRLSVQQHKIWRVL